MLRFVAAVLMVSGALLVVDAAATLGWQEPVSWAIASGREAGLERELAGISENVDGADPAVAAKRLAETAQPGDPIGRISMPTLDRSFVMVQGVGTAALR